MDDNEKPVKEHMARLINTFAQLLPDSLKANESLWKFAKMHDRRSYQLVRFCMAPESDYRTVVKAIVSPIPQTRYTISAKVMFLIERVHEAG